MLMRVINDEFGRLLFPRLYERIHSFLRDVASEVDPDVTAATWLSRWLHSDPSMFLFVDFVDNDIKAHALFEVVRRDHHNYIMVSQLKSDNKRSRTFLEEIDKICKELASELKLDSIMTFVTEHAKYYREKLGYDVSRVVAVFDMKDVEGV